MELVGGLEVPGKATEDASILRSCFASLQNICGAIVQLVRTLACHARGRGFESRWLRHYSLFGEDCLSAVALAKAGANPDPTQPPFIGPNGARSLKRLAFAVLIGRTDCLGPYSFYKVPRPAIFLMQRASVALVRACLAQVCPVGSTSFLPSGKTACRP